MKMINLSAVLAICLLVGCQSLTPQPASSRNYGAASSVAVTRHTQYQLLDKGTFSPGANAVPSSSLISANSDSLSFDWEGDAIELLAELARTRGLQFNYGGVRLPLPVTLHVRSMTFSNVLRLIESQTAWRATLHQYPGLLHITFMQQEARRK